VPARVAHRIWGSTEAGFVPIETSVKHFFNTSVGPIEVLVDPDGDTVSIYRFDAEHRPVAAAMESWRHVDLVETLNREAGVPLFEANTIAAELRGHHITTASFGERLHESKRERGWASLENAGIPLRFVAVLLDAVIVFAPLFILVGLMSGGGYRSSLNGETNFGVDVSGRALLLLIALGIGYYVVCESAAGATLGKHMVGIRVVSEDGQALTFGAAVVRNLLRLVDALFFYLVGFVFAILSTSGQRLGDRAAHTIVVRR
jgi:uncharacterized RDD family membrane protein YckC